MKPVSVLLVLCVVLSLGACRSEDEEPAAAASPVADSAAPVDSAPANLQPEVVVYKSASCGCCRVWVDHMQSHGFPVKVHDVNDLGAVKERVGVPHGMGSCHTAEVGGYFIEGHVPATEVQRLLSEKPEAKGLTVPGMPIGSPGMEQGDRVEPYQVFLVHNDGSTSVYATYPK